MNLSELIASFANKRRKPKDIGTITNSDDGKNARKPRRKPKYGHMHKRREQTRIIGNPRGLHIELHPIDGVTFRNGRSRLFRVSNEGDVEHGEGSGSSGGATAADIATHAAISNAHHNWPLLLGDMPSGLATDTELATHEADENAHHDWPLLLGDMPSGLATDTELATHEADENAHHNWPLLASDIPSSIATNAEVTSEIATHAAIDDAHHPPLGLGTDLSSLLSIGAGQQLTADNQAANEFFAGPASGPDADPAMRPIVFADIPTSNNPGATERILATTSAGAITLSNGKILFSTNGIDIDNDVRIRFDNAAGTQNQASIRMSTDNTIKLSNAVVGGGIQGAITLTDASEPLFLFQEDPTTNNAAQFDITLAVQGTKLTLGGEISIEAAGASGGNTRIGIGTGSPQRPLHIIGDDGAVGTFPSIATRTWGLLENDGNAFYGIISGATSLGGLRFYKDAGTGVRGLIQYNHSSEIIEFGTNGGTVRATLGPGLVIGSPTGGDKGAGTINATAIYDDNVLLTDYVFEDAYQILSINKMTEFYKNNLHLPTIPGRTIWNNEGKFSIGKLATHLWETAEVQAIYISQLSERILTLESNK